MFYVKHFYSTYYLYFRCINQILDLFIKYNWILKIRKLLLIINMLYINKISVTCNQLIDYKSYSLTISCYICRGVEIYN